MPVTKAVWDQEFKRATDYVQHPNLLGHIEKQECYIAYLHMMKSPCWACGEQFNYYEGATESYNPKVYKGSGEEFYCPHCGIEVIYAVPFIAAPNPWFWGNPLIYGNPKRKPRQILPPYKDTNERLDQETNGSDAGTDNGK